MFTRSKSVTIITVIIIVMLFGGFLWLKTHRPNTESEIVPGTSKHAALDIVSGEVSAQMSQTIVQNIESFSGVPVEDGDLQFQAKSYHKVYSADELSYTIQALLVVKKVHSTYKMVLTHSKSNGDSVQIGCAPQSDQPSTKPCVNMQVENL